jgi:hypothetical protein
MRNTYPLRAHRQQKAIEIGLSALQRGVGTLQEFKLSDSYIALRARRAANKRRGSSALQRGDGTLQDLVAGRNLRIERGCR